MRAVNMESGVSRSAGCAAGRTRTGCSCLLEFFFGSIKRLYDQSPSVSYKGSVTVTPTPLPKPYGIDGPMTLSKETDHAWVFAGMRRGGRVVYAFDATGLSATTPTDSTLMWKIGCPILGTTRTATQGSKAGPGVVVAQELQGCRLWLRTAPLLIMAVATTIARTPTRTRARVRPRPHIYVFDAEAGTTLKTFNTDRPAVGDVFVVPDTNGKMSWGYAADMGGNVYRISGVDASTAIVPMTPELNHHEIRLAQMCFEECLHEDPQINFSPDVVSDGGSYVNLVGSGDREKPLRDWNNA